MSVFLDRLCGDATPGVAAVVWYGFLTVVCASLALCLVMAAGHSALDRWREYRRRRAALRALLHLTPRTRRAVRAGGNRLAADDRFRLTHTERAAGNRLLHAALDTSLRAARADQRITDRARRQGARPFQPRPKRKRHA